MRLTSNVVVLVPLVLCTIACGEADDGRGGLTSAATITATTATAGDEDSVGTDDGSGTGDETGGDDDEGGPLKFDIDTAGDDGGGCGGGEVDFSYIWVANSPEGTVSKINTITLEEEGRYLVRPDGQGNPSRTSVSLTGDVAIANRAGDVTKVYAQIDDCVESNGMPGIQTSTGKDDVLPWGQEECIGWYADMQYNVQRPVAWTAGTLNGCVYENQKVWTTGAMADQHGSIVALRLNGHDGTVDATVPVPELGVGNQGPYGGAVDGNGDFWFHSREQGPPWPLVRVVSNGLFYQRWNVPGGVRPYGITVDSKGRVWLAGTEGGVARFTPANQTWDVIPTVTGLGLQEDGEGRMWIAQYPWDNKRGVHEINSDTLQVMNFIDMTAVTPNSRGISVDFYGYVWMVDQTANAFRIDPLTKTWQVYSGLNAPYTYSDMTGWGLKNVTPG